MESDNCNVHSQITLSLKGNILPLSTCYSFCQNFKRDNLPISQPSSPNENLYQELYPNGLKPTFNQVVNPAVNTGFIPIEKDYCNISKRIASFKKWPIQMKQKSLEMAQAGYIYSGKGDLCYCYQCGIGNFNWEYIDHIWKEHKKASPHCKHILAYYLE